LDHRQRQFVTNEAVQRHPDHFSAFAVVPTANPRAAADELERAVTKLGFKGAMVNGMTGGVFHDDKRFWPIWERAAALAQRNDDAHRSDLDVLPLPLSSSGF
jgi:predicted TIM-barrel fold metal-dependent hydrolase